MSQIISVRMIRGIFGLATLAFISQPATAQTTFEWPPATTLDVSRYRTAESCLALSIRIRDSLVRSDSIFRDTMPMTVGENAQQQLSSHAVEIAKQCGAHLDPSEVPLTDFVNTLRLYLMAHRDQDAMKLVERRLEVAPDRGDSTSRRARAAALDTLVSLYLFTQPTRFAAVDPLITELIEMKDVVPWTTRLAMLYRFKVLAMMAGDTTRVRIASERIVAIPPTLTDVQKHSQEFSNSWLVFLTAAMDLHRQNFMDSLRRGTAAYIAYQRTTWARLTGETVLEFRLPIGEPAPQVQGDFWFPDSAALQTHPAPGKVTLIMFWNETSSVMEEYAVVRRLKQRFPDVEVLMLAQTAGQVYPLSPPSPEQEAEQKKNEMDFYRLPATLVVANTPFWRIPGFDRRRINETTANQEAYSFNIPKLRIASALIDRTGRLVWMKSLNRVNEQELNEFTESLLQQQNSESR